MKTAKKTKNTKIFFKYIENELIDEVRIIVIGHEKCTSNKKIQGPLIKNRFIIHYCVSGKGLFNLDGKTYNVNAGDIFFIPANHVIWYKPDKTEPWEYYWFEYSGQNAQKLNERANLTAKSPVYTPLNAEKLTDIFTSLINSLNDTTDDLISVAYVYNFFSIIINERQQKKSSTRTAKDELLKKIFDYISANYSDSTLSLTNIAKHVTMNPSYLSRLFKEATGVPLSRYVIDLRLNKAANLLKRKDLSVKSIAISVGYSDPLYFTREFSRLFNNTPTNYRNQILRAEQSKRSNKNPT